MALSKYDKSLLATVALRDDVKAEFKPLFEHCLNLAADAHRRGNFKRAGMDLAHARKVARY